MKKEVTRRIILNTQKQILFLQLDDIVFIEANGAYTKFYRIDKTVTTAAKNLKSYASLILNNPDFVKVHRSYIINQAHLSAITKNRQSLLFSFVNGVSFETGSIKRSEWMKDIIYQ